MKSIILILFMTGAILITIGYMENYKKCPLPKIEYRYIPRNFYEEQNSQVNLKSLYSNIFDKSSTWSRYPLGDIDMSGKNNMKNFIDDYYS